MQAYLYKTKPSAKQHISLTRDEEAANRMIRNNIIGYGPHVCLIEIEHRTGVPESTLRRWRNKITAEMEKAYPQPVSYPNQLLASSLPSAPATAIGQAPLQLPEWHQGFPPVSTPSTATRRSLVSTRCPYRERSHTGRRLAPGLGCAFPIHTLNSPHPPTPTPSPSTPTLHSSLTLSPAPRHFLSPPFVSLRSRAQAQPHWPIYQWMSPTSAFPSNDSETKVRALCRTARNMSNGITLAEQTEPSLPTRPLASLRHIPVRLSLCLTPGVSLSLAFPLRMILLVVT